MSNKNLNALAEPQTLLGFFSLFLSLSANVVIAEAKV